MMIGGQSKRNAAVATSREMTELLPFTFTTEEGRNDVDTLDVTLHPLPRELMTAPPTKKRSSKRLSLMTVLAAVLIFFASIKIGFYAGFRLINMDTKTAKSGTQNSESGTHDVSEEKSIDVSNSSKKVERDFSDLVNDKPESCNLKHFARRFKHEELEINCNNFAEVELGRVVGRGFARQVYEATWQGNRVAVKEYLNAEDGKWRLMKEVPVLFQLREAENIVKLLGWCNSTIVLEYAPLSLGDLAHDKKMDISVWRALSLGLDVVKGLAQVHNINIVHGDVSQGNYLINPKGKANGPKVLLGDFDWSGYAGEKCSYDRGYCPKCWWPDYRAPEVLSNQRGMLDKKTDIYEVALVLWTLLAREDPFEKIDKENRHKRIIAGERPDLSLLSGYPQEMSDLIAAAWDGNPLKRPSAAYLVKRMEEILANYTKGLMHQT